MNDTASQLQSFPILDVVGGIFLLIGLVCLIPAVRTLREEIDSRSWPQIEASLRDAEAVKTIYEENEKRHYRRFVSYQVEMNYEYRVNGQRYKATSHKVAESGAVAATLATEAAIGDVRKIYYNPLRPERYRFALNPISQGLFWFIPVAAFSGFGALVLYVGRKFY